VSQNETFRYSGSFIGYCVPSLQMADASDTNFLGRSILRCVRIANIFLNFVLFLTSQPSSSLLSIQQVTLNPVKTSKRIVRIEKNISQIKIVVPT
jgi:hypothetical protein